MTFAMSFAFGVWMALFNNFAVDVANLNGAHIGVLQSWREVPGFLAFAVVWVLLIMTEQRLALLSLLLLGVGVALTGYMPSFSGLLITTMLMSVGFHYYETIRQSLALQWFSKAEAPVIMGNLVAVSSAAALLSYAWTWLAIEILVLDLAQTMLVGGVVTIILAAIAAAMFPTYTGGVEQNKRLVFRKRYMLYYALTFMGGARRQIFFVFAALLLVQKFNFSAQDIALVFLLNGAINMWVAPKIGKFVAKFGERTSLILEYVGLILVFSAYGWVDSAPAAVGLYVLDNILFAMAIAQSSYIKKIADPADMASTAGVSFTINHIAAVILPALLGVLWLWSPLAVFLSGAAMACVSLYLALWVPKHPDEGNEWQRPALFAHDA
jgi:predicted MFS family arabinose efflux permease